MTNLKVTSMGKEINNVVNNVNFNSQINNAQNNYTTVNINKMIQNNSFV
jgi:hypothetical protein